MKPSRLTVLLVFLGAALCAASPAAAVQISAGTGSGIAGDTVDVAIDVSDLTALGVVSYQFTLTYSSTRVTALDVLETGTLSAGYGDATFNVTSGQISVSHAGSSALTGSGTLLTIRFQINPTATTATSASLTFQDFLFNEGSPEDTTSNGLITISATPVITTSPGTGELVRGDSLQFSVSGSVTNPVSWGTTDAAVATIASTGLLTGVSPGAVRVFAVDAIGLRDTTNGDIDIRGMGVTVGSTSEVQGQPGSVAVTVSDLTGLGVRSGQLTITFSSSRVAATGMTTAGTLLDGYGTSLFGSTPGSVTVSFAGSSDLVGSGTLVILDFVAGTTLTGTATLTLTEALFNEDLPAVRTNGSFVVTALPSITVTPETVELLAGETQLFSLTGSPTPPITWSTLDPSVATIDAGGLLTAVAGGITRVRAVDDVAASDENTSVTVFDFEVSIPTIDGTPGSTVQVPINVDRDVSGLGIFSMQYDLIHSATVVTNATATAQGLIGLWGTPTSNVLSDRIVVAGAGSQTLGAGDSFLHVVDLDISPSALVGTNVTLTLSDLLFNEGAPVARVVNGLLRIVEVTGVESLGDLALALAQNVPNPFGSGGTRIDFTVPKQLGSDGHRLRLAIYGVDGRRIRTLVDEVMEAGRHEVTWDGRDQSGRRVAAGIYFSRLQWQGEHMEKKLIVVR